MTGVAPALAAQVRGLLAQASVDTVPGGVLAWWGQTELPDGVDRVPTLGQGAFEGAYFLLENAALARGVVRPFAAVQAATRDMRADGPLPIAIASFPMAVPRADLAEQVRAAAASGGALESPPASIGDAIEERRFFAATGVLHDQWGRPAPVYRGRDVRFVLDPSFHLTPPGGKLPDAVEADLGDGRGWQPVAFGAPFGASYPDADSATVALRCTYGDAVLTARFTVALSDDAAPPAPDETWALQGTAAPGDPRPAGNTGRAYVYRGAGHDAVVNPVILVEGFPGGHAVDYLYELFDQAGTLEAMRARGYDVVIVGLDQGGDLIQRNASVLEDCIRQARAHTDRPLVVGGVSMGGIVARLALARIEARGDDHGARLYVSIDSPHRGAYTSLGVQWFVHSMKGFAPGLASFAQLLDAPSNQQMMIAWLHDGAAQVSPLRERLLADLQAAGGHPRRPRRIAVSCGRGDGVRGAEPGVPTLSWSGDPFVSAALRTLPGPEGGTVASGSWWLGTPVELPPLAVDAGSVAWEGVPGGQATYNGQVAAIAAGIACGAVAHDLDTTCSVPVVSALDLDTDPLSPVPPPGAGGSPFHAHVCSAANELHLTITPEVSRWLLNELGDPPMPAQAASTPAKPAWDPATFDPHDPGFLRDPYPVYARFREHAPVHLVPQYGSNWVFRHADVQQVLQDKETFVKNSPTPGDPPPGPIRMLGYLGRGLFSSDPPRHTELRGVLEPLFRAAIPQAPQIAGQIAKPILDKARLTGRMELVTDYALPVPSGVLFSVLGVPNDPGVWPGLVAWQSAIVAAHDITAPMSVRASGATCSMALQTFLQGYVAMASKAPQPGLLGEMVQAIGPGFTAVDVQLCASDLIVAGYLSTTYLIASGLRHLLEHPDQLAALRADPSLMPGAVQEMLRMDAPAQLVDRVAATDTELGGVALKAGDRVTAVLGSADHDPEAFESPDEFRIDRQDQAQVSFGAGIHHCIGAPLVALVGPAAMSALIELPVLELAGLVQWQSDPYLRGMLNMPLRTA